MLRVQRFGFMVRGFRVCLRLNSDPAANLQGLEVLGPRGDFELIKPHVFAMFHNRKTDGGVVQPSGLGLCGTRG